MMIFLLVGWLNKEPISAGLFNSRGRHRPTQKYLHTKGIDLARTLRVAQHISSWARWYQKGNKLQKVPSDGSDKMCVSIMQHARES